MCDADRQTETYQHTLKHYIFVIGDMSLIDCINVGDCVVQQIRYLPMLFTIPHHLSSVCSGWNVAHLIWISLISEFFFIIWGPACFLLPVKTLCHLDTFWLLTWRAKMFTSLGNPLLHWNRLCNNLWYSLINWPVFLGCWTFVPVFHINIYIVALLLLHVLLLFVACSFFIFVFFHCFCILLLLLSPLSLPPPHVYVHSRSYAECIILICESPSMIQ